MQEKHDSEVVKSMGTIIDVWLVEEELPYNPWYLVNMHHTDTGRHQPVTWDSQTVFTTSMSYLMDLDISVCLVDTMLTTTSVGYHSGGSEK